MKSILICTFILYSFSGFAAEDVYQAPDVNMDFKQSKFKPKVQKHQDIGSNYKIEEVYKDRDLASDPKREDFGQDYSDEDIDEQVSEDTERGPSSQRDPAQMKKKAERKARKEKNNEFPEHKRWKPHHMKFEYKN